MQASRSTALRVHASYPGKLAHLRRDRAYERVQPNVAAGRYQFGVGSRVKAQTYVISVDFITHIQKQYDARTSK